MLPGFQQVKYAVGQHEVDDDVAEHWYVKAHSDLIEEVAMILSEGGDLISQAQGLVEQPANNTKKLGKKKK